MDERLTGLAAKEGIDDISISDVWELVALLGDTLDVLLEGLVGPLPVVVEVPQVLGPSVRTLEVADEDRMEITPAVDAARLELLEPSSGRP